MWNNWAHTYWWHSSKYFWFFSFLVLVRCIYNGIWTWNRTMFKVDLFPTWNCGDLYFPRRSFSMRFYAHWVFSPPVFSPIGVFSAGFSQLGFFHCCLFLVVIFHVDFLNNEINWRPIPEDCNPPPPRKICKPLFPVGLKQLEFNKDYFD